MILAQDAILGPLCKTAYSPGGAAEFPSAMVISHPSGACRFY